MSKNKTPNHYPTSTYNGMYASASANRRGSGEPGRLQRFARRAAGVVLALTIAGGVGEGVDLADKAGWFKTDPGNATEYSPADEAKLAAIIAPQMRSIDQQVLTFDAAHPNKLVRLPAKNPNEVRLYGTTIGDGSKMQTLDVVMGMNADGTPNPDDPRYIKMEDDIEPSGPQSEDAGKQFIAPGGEAYADGLSLHNQADGGKWGGWSAASYSLVAKDGVVDLYLGGSIDTSNKQAYVQNPDDPYGPTDKYLTARMATDNADAMLDSVLRGLGEE